MFLGLFIFLGTMAIALLASARVKRAYAAYSKVPTRSGYSGAEAAQQILHAAGIHDVEIEQIDDMLGDHYDPSNKRLVLSRDNFYGTSVAALGIAAHECGHAIQHRIAYAPLQWRMTAVYATTFASQIVTWLPLLGYMGGFFRGTTALYIMAAAWGVIMLFNLITLPVEFDASRRAKVILGQMGFIHPGEESQGVNRVLNAAGWTYVAAFVTSLAWMIYYLLPLLTGGSRRDE